MLYVHLSLTRLKAYQKFTHYLYIDITLNENSLLLSNPSFYIAYPKHTILFVYFGPTFVCLELWYFCLTPPFPNKQSRMRAYGWLCVIMILTVSVTNDDWNACPYMREVGGVIWQISITSSGRGDWLTLTNICHLLT